MAFRTRVSENIDEKMPNYLKQLAQDFYSRYCVQNWNHLFLKSIKSIKANPLHYSGEEKSDKKRPVMIHRAILGSVERMMAILTENFAGKW